MGILLTEQRSTSRAAHRVRDHERTPETNQGRSAMWTCHHSTRCRVATRAEVRRLPRRGSAPLLTRGGRGRGRRYPVYAHVALRQTLRHGAHGMANV